MLAEMDCQYRQALHYNPYPGIVEKQMIRQTARIFGSNQGRQPQEYFVYFKAGVTQS